MKRPFEGPGNGGLKMGHLFLLDLPSGKLTQLVKIAIEIVDFAIEHGGSFHSYVANYQRVFPFFNADFSGFS